MKGTTQGLIGLAMALNVVDVSVCQCAGLFVWIGLGGRMLLDATGCKSNEGCGLIGDVSYAVCGLSTRCWS